MACGEVTAVVNLGVDHAQRDEPPVHGTVGPRGALPDTFARHLGEGAQRIETEVDVHVVRGVRAPWLSGCRGGMIAQVADQAGDVLGHQAADGAA